MALSFADSDNPYSPSRSLGLLLAPEKKEPPPTKQSMWHRLGLRRWLGRDDRDFPLSPSSPTPTNNNTNNYPGDSSSTSSPRNSHDNLTRRLSRKVGVGLPRAPTFKRQNSERRDNLAPLDPEPRRAVSADRRTHRALSAQRTRTRSPPHAGAAAPVDPRLSAPEVQWCAPAEEPQEEEPETKTTVEEHPATNEDSDTHSEWTPYPYPPDATDTPDDNDIDPDHDPDPPDDLIEMELEKRWILNLSMHFRDHSEREKFFVTFAETPTKWRRVTISCDYRNATPDSLEQDLKELRYQRDKCARIYESIRESLAEIQFYDTVTNLKLETRDGRLHVHVTEDVNEIIPYPPVSCIGHLPEARLVPEDKLHFDAHLSGFVYNVRLDGRTYIKKEIPGPDTVDEFLYEINALHALQGTPNVVQVEGVVVDDRREVVKGLMISFAEKGALVDILYEERGNIAWERRERWAKQIVQGLCEIHEAGYVQGDFTLSNIVVDANDDAKIIDINRRGCPVGWEPPEIAVKIESNQRISMYIGVKTDLFQLGMTLWALATEEDEPERQPRPLFLSPDLHIPDYYRRLVAICLNPIPRHRLSAKELLNFFPHGIPTGAELPFLPVRPHRHPNMSVGLHNGILPLYNSRVLAAPAGFLSPRPGGPGDAFPPSPGLEPEPEPDSEDTSQDVVPLSREFPQPDDEDARVLEARDPESPFERKSPEPSRGRAYSDDGRSHVLRPARPVALKRNHNQNPHEDLESLSLESEDKGIELSPDALYPYNHHSSAAAAPAAPDMPSFAKPHPLPVDLAGVGAHSPPSPKPESTNDLPSTGSAQSGGSPVSVSAASQSTDPDPCSAPSQTTADIGRALIPDHDWASQVRTPSVSSLLHSILPINPALSPDQKSIEQPTADKLSPLTIRSALGYSRQVLKDTPFLNDSLLPINPAFSDKTLASV